METKKCTGNCGEVKYIIEFSVRPDNDKPNGKCKECVRKYYEKYRKDKSNDVKKRRRSHYLENRNLILKNKKAYYKENRDHILDNAKKYYEKKREELRIKHKCYYQDNREKILSGKKLYGKNNRKKLSNYTIRYFKLRRQNDPLFALRCDLSTSIGRALRLNNSSKSNQSIITHLPYSIEELKQHLEKQFESWMNWNNWGKYNAATWNDNDRSTWTWQIDHIIPHSTFNYSSLNDQAFKDCWTLSNLRPLSSKKNQADGASKTRHK